MLGDAISLGKNRPLLARVAPLPPSTVCLGMTRLYADPTFFRAQPPYNGPSAWHKPWLASRLRLLTRRASPFFLVS